MSEIWELGVVELATRIRQREVLPIEVVRCLLERIAALDPGLQAWQRVDADGALAAADGLERRLTAGEPLGPLAGVPIGIKDYYDVAGLPTTAGSPLLAENIAERDAVAIARLRAADALILGKTVTTAFAYADPPPTRNPWNLEHTPGGSSSGSAAAVAARMVPAAIGTQTAGSGLRPAAYCGVVGLKPSYGRISRRGILPFSWSMDTPAIHARSVDDAATVLANLAGQDPTDSTTLARPSLDFGARSKSAPRLGLLSEMVASAEPELRDHLRVSAGRLAKAGARVEEARLPFPNELMIAIHHLIQQVESVVGHEKLFHAQADKYPDRLRAYLEVGQFLPGAAYVHAQRVRRRVFEAVGAMLDRFDALLLPAAQGPAPVRDTTGSYVMLAGWTMLGLPAASLPTGLSAAGLPLALQLVGRFAADARLVETAGWCERVLDPLPFPPGMLGVPSSSMSTVDGPST